MGELKAIQTEYKGYLFRSRLEARWAVFLDACGADWEYEPEGYDLGDGLYYLPDFLIHGVTVNHGYFKKNCDIYLEVKGRMNAADAEKINRFYDLGYEDESNGAYQEQRCLWRAEFLTARAWMKYWTACKEKPMTITATGQTAITFQPLTEIISALIRALISAAFSRSSAMIRVIYGA